MLNKFHEVWSIEKDWWDSDIDIIKNNNWKISIYKKYYSSIPPKIKDKPIFTLKDIKKYHKIQNQTWLIKNEIILDENITLLWNKINKISLDILKLDENEIYYASDIKTKTRVIITQPEYIEWTTFNEYLKNLEYQKSKEIKQIIIDNIISDKKTYSMNWWSFELSQISTFNIKVLWINNWTIKVLITDIAQKISEIVK
jgi:hypothetical protein